MRLSGGAAGNMAATCAGGMRIKLFDQTRTKLRTRLHVTACQALRLPTPLPRHRSPQARGREREGRVRRRRSDHYPSCTRKQIPTRRRAVRARIGESVATAVAVGSGRKRCILGEEKGVIAPDKVGNSQVDVNRLSNSNSSEGKWQCGSGLAVSAPLGLPHTPAQTHRWTKRALHRIAAESDQTEPRVPALNRAVTYAHNTQRGRLACQCGAAVSGRPHSLTGSASAHLATGSPPLHRSRALRRTRRAAGCEHDRWHCQWRSAPLPNRYAAVVAQAS